MLRSVELFSGCGGLAMGLAVAGFRHELMIEWDAEAVRTVSHNKERGVQHVIDWPIRLADVRGVDWRQFSGKIDLVAGGPPCQPFSIGGKHKGQDDPRDMWPEAIRAVREALPRAFLFENVRGLVRPAFADYLQWITAQLRRPDLKRRAAESHDQHALRLRLSKKAPTYDVIVAQVNAADFGAAQKRQRVIVAGIRSDLGLTMAAPVPTHSRERLLWEQWVTGEYWQRHALSAPSEKALPQMDRSIVARLRASRLCPATQPWKTVRDAIANLGSPSGLNNHAFQPGARIYVGHTGSPIDQPAKALKAGDHGVPGGENMVVHSDGTVRYFTVREAARLQGLPDEFQFPRSWSESMRQLGNAVPTQLSEAMARWIMKLLAEDTLARAAA